MPLTAPTLGGIGDRVDLLIRRGATFGPHRIAFTNPDGTAMNLTGCTLRAALRKRAGDVAALLDFVCVIDTPAITDPAVDSQAVFGATATATAALDLGSDGAGVWKMDMQDAAGRIIAVFYGAASLVP